MPKITNNETVQAIAQEYCSNGLKKIEALLAAGYSKSYAKTLGLKLYADIRLIKAIAEIQAGIAAENGHSYEIAVQMLTKRIAYLEPAAVRGNVQAIQAQTALIRELDNITGLQKQTIQHKGQTEPVLDEAERKALADLARAYKLKIA